MRQRARAKLDATAALRRADPAKLRAFETTICILLSYLPREKGAAVLHEWIVSDRDQPGKVKLVDAFAKHLTPEQLAGALERIELEFQQRGLEP